VVAVFFYFPEQNYSQKRCISFDCLLSHGTWGLTVSGGSSICSSQIRTGMLIEVREHRPGMACSGVMVYRNSSVEFRI
jgi:hypothetical protein